MPDGRPAVPAPAEIAYELLRPLARRDPANGWLLLRLLSGFGAGTADAYAVLQDPGMAELLDPETAPAEWLPFIGKVVGARLTPGMTVEQQRAEAANPSGWTRGSVPAIAAAAYPFMRAPFRVRIRTRYDPALGADVDAPDDLQVRLREDDVVDETLAIRAVLAAIPWDLTGHVVVTNERDWDDVDATYPDWDSVESGNADWDALRSA